MTSRETQAIIDYVVTAGLSHRVTAIVGTWKSVSNPCSPHAAGSLHCAEGTGGKGLAVDFGGAEPGTSLESIAQMKAIHAALMRVAPQLAELIYNGPGTTRAVKNGKIIDGLRIYGVEAWAAHRNHVHVAVHKGTFISWTEPIEPVLPARKKVFPLYSPPIQVEPIVADLACPTGGAWLLAASGAVYAFGGAPYLGGPNGKAYFEGRVAARLEPVDGKYTVVAESGEKYGPGF